MNSEDLKTIREALHDYAVLANHMNDEVCPSYGPDAQKAEEAIELFDAHVAALTQQEAEPVAERFNECVHGVTFNSECEQCSAECAAGLPPQSQKVRIDMGAAVMDRLIHVGYTNAEQIEYVKDESEGEGAFYSDTEDDCVIPLYMLKVHAHRLGYPVAESSPPKPAALPQPDRKFNERIHRVNFNSECAQCAAESAAGIPPQQSDEEKWEPECGCRFENDHSSAVVLCDECRDLPCHNQGGIVPQPVASVPQDVEEWIALNMDEVTGTICVSDDEVRDLFRDILAQREAQMAGKVVVPVARIESVVRDVDYLRETPRRTQPFVRINFTHEDYDSRDTVCAVLASASQEGV